MNVLVLKNDALSPFQDYCSLTVRLGPVWAEDCTGVGQSNNESKFYRVYSYLPHTHVSEKTNWSLPSFQVSAKVHLPAQPRPLTLDSKVDLEVDRRVVSFYPAYWYA